MRDPVKYTAWETSVSAVTTYLDCARKYYYNYIDKSKEPRKTNYYLIMGSIVHDMVRKFHVDGTPEKPFFYKDVKAAKGNFVGRWWFNLKENADSLMEKNYWKAQELAKAGQRCIENYWNLMFPLHKVGRGTPLEVEKRFKHFDEEHRIVINGKPDQIRKIPKKIYRMWNPDAVDDRGNLKPGYLPHVILDLKTGRHNYSIKGKKSKKLNKNVVTRLARNQFALHESLQATVYTYHHEKKFGALPLSFAYYYLREGQLFPTDRTHRDFPDMFERMHHVQDNIASGSFPKNENPYKCPNCQHLERCAGDRGIVLVNPLGNSKDFTDSKVIVSAEAKEPKPKQLKLNMKVERKKRNKAES